MDGILTEANKCQREIWLILVTRCSRVTGNVKFNKLNDQYSSHLYTKCVFCYLAKWEVDHQVIIMSNIYH